MLAFNVFGTKEIIVYVVVVIVLIAIGWYLMRDGPEPDARRRHRAVVEAQTGGTVRASAGVSTDDRHPVSSK